MGCRYASSYGFILFLFCTRINGVYEGILGYFMHNIVSLA